ncbi:hypothetical protein JD969_09170 [Planctomycetota bacterium]|nr:hypothetical protein JD969_09170 [Planctomycetota bacterium]
MPDQTPQFKTITTPLNPTSTFTYKMLWQTRLKRLRKILKYTFIFFLTITLLITAFWLTNYIRARHAFNNIAHYRTGDQINQHYDQLANTERAASYTQALLELDTAYELTDNISLFDRLATHQFSLITPTPPEIRARIDTLLDRNQEAIKSLITHNNLGPIRFQHDYNAPTAKIPYLDHVHEIASLLTLKILIHFKDNHPEPALDTTLALIQYAKSLQHDPHGFSQTMVKYLHNYYIPTIIDAISQTHPFTSDQIKQIQDAYAAHPYDPRAAAYDMVLAQQFISLQHFENEPRFQLPLSHLPLTRDLDHIETIRFFDTIFTQLQNQSDDFSWIYDYSETIRPYHHIAREASWLVNIDFNQKFYKSHNHILFSLAAERYYLDHNNTPHETDADLVPTYLKELPTEN